MTGRLSLIVALLLAGCAHADAPARARAEAAPAEELPIGVTPRNRIVPLLDAHQHMMSPEAMALTAPPAPLPPIALPPALAELLRAREGVADSASYAAVFSDDAMMLAEEQGRWRRGAETILDAIGNFPSGLSFVPKSYAVDGSAGFISGNLRDSAGQETHHFTLGIRQSADRRWRIVSEMKQPVMPPAYAPVITAEHIINVLDDAGIRYGTVLSVGYWFGREGRGLADPYGSTRAENDWVIAESAKYSDRLIPFCGVNPLADHAVAEIERCAGIPAVRGMKIHRNSRFDLTNPAHLERMRLFFRTANRHGLAIVIHHRGDVQILIDRVLPEAPDVPIQIAHMASSWDNARLFADAIEAGRPGTGNLWFDWTQALPIEGLWSHGPGANLAGTATDAEKAEVVGIMRRLGMGRILYGTDMPLPWNPSPREWWRKTILTLPLTDDEIRDIADNLPPYIPR